MRLGTVSYLNARPLVYRFLREPDPGLSLEQAVPSALVARLRQRELDAALISSIECFRGDGFEMLPGVGIVSHGPVLSILVFCRTPIRKVKTLALDSSSRSGAALTRILFREHWSNDPTFIRHAPNLSQMLQQADAALLIGDPALRANGRALAGQAEGVEVYDLGQVWMEMTGLPFVFAVWAGWPGVFNAEWSARLIEAKEYGKAHLAELALAESQALDLPFDLCRRYLGGAIQYDVGQTEAKGLRQFIDLARRHGLLEPD